MKMKQTQPKPSEKIIELLNKEQAEQVKQELMEDLDEVNVPTKDELTKELGSHYILANRMALGNYGLIADMKTVSGNKSFSLAKLGESILEKIKKAICAVLKGGSTVSDVIDAVLDAISSIIPGGVLIKSLLKKLVKYILSIGVNKFCGFTPAS
jgi:hypothetical protein